LSYFLKNIDNTINLSNIVIPNTNKKIGNCVFGIDIFNFNQEYVDFIKDITKNIANDTTKFIIQEEIECDDFTKNKNFIYNIDLFKQLEILDRITFMSNYENLKTEYNFKYFPFFLGRGALNEYKNQSDKKIIKKFLFLNRVPKIHRRIIYDFLKSNSILDDCYWSFGTKDSYYADFIEDGYPFRNVKGESSDVSVPDMHELIDEYKSSFINIVTESYCFLNDEVKRPWDTKEQPVPTFITEKTEKSFRAMIPFIIVSTPFFLKKLKELGFKTFDKWWDESYDDEVDDYKRLQKICNLILEVSNWDIYKCEQVYKEMMPVLKHNKHNSLKYRVQKEKITDIRQLI